MSGRVSRVRIHPTRVGMNLDGLADIVESLAIPYASGDEPYLTWLSRNLSTVITLREWG